MRDKPVNEILNSIAQAAEGEASPGTALGKVSKWRPDPFHILIATVLSQRNRDECTYLAARRLFEVYDSPKDLAGAPQEEVDELIHSVNFHFGKTEAIRKIARIIHVDYHDQVPSDVNALMALPMVGRKTATCVQAYAFKIDAICVDTHVHRISNRIGLVRTRTPAQTEEKLMKIVPKNRWREVNEIMVRFGQQICTPLHPKHGECNITQFCDYYQKHRGKKD